MYTEDETLLQDLSNFQIFMKVVQDPRALDKKNSMIQVLSLLLPNCKVAFLPNSFIITCNGQASSIDEKNFDLFQNILSEIFCLKSTYNQSGFNPGGKKSKEIAEKWLDKYKYDNKTKKIVTTLVEYHDFTFSPTKKYVKRMLNKLGEDMFRKLIAVRKADILAQNPKFTLERSIAS